MPKAKFSERTTKGKTRTVTPFSPAMHMALDTNKVTAKGRKERDKLAKCPPGHKKGL
jgi:hypothetical protein